MPHPRRLFKRTERGQAMAEYHVLIPGSILLVIAVAWLIGPPIKSAFLRVLRPMVAQKTCVPAYDIDDNSICSHHGDCEKVEKEDMDSGTFEFQSAVFVESVVIKAGENYIIYWTDPDAFDTITEDGCYQVPFSGTLWSGKELTTGLHAKK